MKRKLLSAAFALLGISAAWAQGTWNPPIAPGVDPLTANGNVYLYNIEADAFVNAGMNWGTKAIATRLERGDSWADNRHAMTIINVEGSNFQMKLNMLKNANNGDNTSVIYCGDGTVNDIWADKNTNPYWTASESEIYKNAYTLQNKKYSEYKLDVAWLYGGPLTVAEGQEFYDWAFIPAESITDGSFAQFKERRKMYAIYQELVNTNNVSKYADALSTANNVYINESASKTELRAATRALLIAVADGIENPVNANSLFDNADILGDNNNAKDWSADFGVTNGVYERYHTQVTLQQSKTDLPNGLYDVIFHGLYRQDDNATEAAPHLTVTGSNVLEDDLNLIGTLAEQWKVDGGGNEKNGDMGQWTGTGGKQVPNHQWGANQGMTLEDAVAKINNVQVKEGSLKIELAITGKSQWVLFQGFDIIYNGPINVALYKKIVAAKEEAEGYVTESMEATVKSALNDAIETASKLTSNSEEDALNSALEALDKANKDASASIALYKDIKSVLDDLQKEDKSFSAEKYENGEYSSVEQIYPDYYSYEISKLDKSAGTDYTAVIINSGFELGNTLGWTFVPSADFGAKSTSDETYSMSGSEGNYLFNIWSKGNPITQTIVGLPEGYYQLKAVVAGADGNGAGKVYLIANDSHEGVRCDVDKTKGTEGSIIAKVEADGILKIGVVGANNDAGLSYIESGMWWYKVDDFRLTYMGSDVSDDIVNAVLAKVPTGKMNKDVSDALNGAKATLENEKTLDNIQALQVAITTANASIAAYANLNDYIGKVEALLNSSNSNFYTVEAYENVYNKYKEGYETGVIKDDEIPTYKVAGSSGDARYTSSTAQDLFVQGWTIDGKAATANGSGFYMNTWSTENSGLTDDAKDFANPFFEKWVASGSLPATTLQATISAADMEPNAVYDITATVRVQGSSKVAGSITMEVVGGKKVDVTAGNSIKEKKVKDGKDEEEETGRYIRTYTATGITDAEGNLTLKFEVAVNSNISWLSFRDVKYAKKTVEVAITEAGYATFSSEEYALGLDNLPEGLEAYYVQAANVSKGSDDEGYVILTAIDEAVDAGEGILLKGAKGTYDIPVAVSGSPLEGNILKAGKGEDVEAGNYVFSCKKVEGGEVADPSTAGFYKLGEATVVPKGKAYLDFQGDTVPAKALYFVFGDDNATAVEAIEVADAEADGVLYNLAGQQVGKDYKGIVIKNGKKYLNK